MSDNRIKDSKRIARNTVALYMRSIVVMAVGIYTSRVVLKTLGVDDYGIYNVVGTFVAMFSILSGSLVNASQRFISFEMGKETPQMNRMFCATLSIHILLALGVLVVFETFGLWFLNTQLNIDPERMVAANWVYQCSVITFSVNLIDVPYNASIIAHEKMSAYAYFSIFEVCAKLGIVYLLLLTGKDRLIMYAIFMLSVAVLLRLLYRFYCIRKFEECRYHFVIDKELFKEMLGFTGWNFIGSAAGLVITQGINVLINIFFGVALNAARGLAEQVNQAINTFVTNFMTAVNPQITKSYSAGEYDYMNNLMVRGAKYAALLYWFMALTIFVEAETILDIWLVETPPYTVIFLRWAVICSIFQALSHTLYIGMLATGNIRKYQITMGSLYLGSFLLCLVFFKCGLGPEYGYISTFVAYFIAVVVRLKLISQIVPGFSVTRFLTQSILRSFGVIILSTSFVILFKRWITIENRWMELLTVLAVSLIVTAILAYVIALSKDERRTCKEQVMSSLKKK